MRTINLDATTSSIEIKLAWAVTTNQLDWTCSWYDTTIADWTVLEWKTTWVTNNTTAVTVCAAPASWHTRTIKCITIYNADTVNATPIVQLNDNSSLRVIYRNTLTTLSSVSLDDMSIITDISWKIDWPASATNENIAVFDWITWKLIKDWWANIASLQLSKASWSDVDTWTDDAKFVTAKAIEDSSYMKNPMTTAWDVIYWWASWVPTRLAKGTAWQVLKMNSWATAPEWWEWGWSVWGSYLFAVAWTIWATWTNVSATHIANWTQTITSVDLWYGTAWNGTLTVDVNKNGTTIFSTTKPTITSTNQSSINSWTLTTTSLASGDILTINIDWVPATIAPVDLYVRVNYS